MWYAADHATNKILASYVSGKRKDIFFKQLKALLDPFGIRRYYTDDWGSYDRCLEADEHEAGKSNTQKIERKNLNFRTRIKWLARKKICFSKLEKMHDIVIGLLINKVEFGLDIHAKLQLDPSPNKRYADNRIIICSQRLRRRESRCSDYVEHRVRRLWRLNKALDRSPWALQASCACL